jgi:hypothetical protein
MKQNILKPTYRLIVVFFLGITMAFGQGENINLLSGVYDQDPYPKYNPNGNVTGTYTVRASKSAHTFTDGQFRIVIGFPEGAVYAGGATLPAGFSIISGADGSSAVEIGITGNWTGSGPTAVRTFVLPIKIVGPANDQPTATVLQWDDPFINENPVANSTGSALNVNNVLPVKLAFFNVVKESTTALISWATTEEANSDRFEIERSQNGKNWEKIGTVAANGESSDLKHYRLTDDAPQHGENLYRLKMIDMDTKFSYSTVRSITVDADIFVYPNPSSDFIRVRDTDKASLVSIIDLNGKTVHKAVVNSKGEISVKNIATGMYSVRVERHDGAKSVHKLVIAR